MAFDPKTLLRARLFLHVCLVTLITSQVCYVNSRFSAYSRAVGRNFVNLMFPEGYEDDMGPYVSKFQYYIYTVDDTVSDAQRLVTSYAGLPSVSVNKVKVNTCDGGDGGGGGEHDKILECPKLRVRYSDADEDDHVYPLRNVSTGWPLSEQAARDEAGVRAFLTSVDTMSFDFEVRADSFGSTRICYVWEVAVEYDLSSHGQILVSSLYSPAAACSEAPPSEPEHVLSAIGVVVASLYQALLFEAVGRKWAHDEREREAVRGNGARARGMAARSVYVRCGQILQVFDLWFFFSTAGVACTLAYGFYTLTTHVSVAAATWLKGSMGLACVTLWASLTQYLEFNPRYFVLVLTLRKAVPRVGQFLLGVSPIFFGYLLLGMVMFGDQSDDFADIGSTAATLFAVVNGDVILDTFKELSFSAVAGNIYLYVYILLFMYVVLMTVIAIVEEAFFSSSRAVLVPNDEGEARVSTMSEDEHPLLKANDSVFEILDARSRWGSRAESGAGSGAGTAAVRATAALEDELARLREENERLRVENGVAVKAAAGAGGGGVG